MRKLTRNDINMPILLHYLKTTKLPNPPVGIIPPPIKEYDDFYYLLCLRKYAELADYSGKIIDMCKTSITSSLEQWWNGLENIDRVGIWLSGGFDSCLLLKLTADILGSDRVIGVHLDFGDASEEIRNVKLISDSCDTKLIIKKIVPNDMFKISKEACLLLRAPTSCPHVLYLAKTCAENGIEKALSGLGLDVLSGAEYKQIMAKNNSDFEKATTEILNYNRDFVWVNLYQSRGYVDLKFPFLNYELVDYMRGLPVFHKVYAGSNRTRLRNEVKAFHILPNEIAEYGKVAGTKKGFLPNWKKWYEQEYKDWLLQFNPSQYIDISQFPYWKQMPTSWFDCLKQIMLANTCLFYELIDEGEFFA